MLDPFQSSLAPKTVEALICLQNWLRSTPLSYDLDMVDEVESYKLDSGQRFDHFSLLNDILLFTNFIYQFQLIIVIFFVSFFVEVIMKNASILLKDD